MIINAAANDHEKVVRNLLDHINDSVRDELLQCAVIYKHENVLELLKSCADFESLF